MTFLLGNPNACWEYGLVVCTCGPTLRDMLEQ